MHAAREEAELVLFDSVDAILQKNKLKPSQVGCPDSDLLCLPRCGCTGGKWVREGPCLPMVTVL